MAEIIKGMLHNRADPDIGNYRFSKPVVFTVINAAHLREVAEEVYEIA